MTLAWTNPLRLEPGEPRAPYAHFSRRQEGTAPDIPEKKAPSARYRSLDVAEQLLSCAASLPWSEAGRVVFDELLEEYGPAAARREPPAAGSPDAGERLPDDTVFVGIVDDAIAFANERFRFTVGDGKDGKKKERTRVDYFWLPGAPVVGPAPTHFPVGRELRCRDIERLFDKHSDPAVGLDEAGLYRDPAVGLIDMSMESEIQSAALHESHGTGVLDLAAGFDRDDPQAPRIRIAAVCLPSQVTSDTLGTLAELYVILGVDRILAHVDARSDGRAFPVVINVSLALTGGPKDGTSILDRYLDHIVEQRAQEGKGAVYFVLPAGNHRLARTHARLAADGAQDRILWRLLPDDSTPSFLEIWGPRERDFPASPTFDVGLAPPGADEAMIGAAHALDGLGDPERLEAYRRGIRFELKNESRVFAWAYRHWVPSSPSTPNRGRERVTLVALPTIGSRPGASVTVAGDWTVVVKAADKSDRVPLDLYIQRDDTLPGFRRRGRQSYFVDGDYQRYDARGFIRTTDDGQTSPIRRAGTINSFATGSAPLVVGGCYDDDLAELAYFGRGRAEQDGHVVHDPDILAPCERSPVRNGVRAAASESGSFIFMSGTSAAAPAVARAKALALLGEPVAPGLDQPTPALTAAAGKLDGIPITFPGMVGETTGEQSPNQKLPRLARRGKDFDRKPAKSGAKPAKRKPRLVRIMAWCFEMLWHSSSGKPAQTSPTARPNSS